MRNANGGGTSFLPMTSADFGFSRRAASREFYQRIISFVPGWIIQFQSAADEQLGAAQS